MVDAATFQDDDFAALFAESIAQENAKEGEILRGTVISVGKDFAIVDIGYKSEGQVALEEFRGADGTITVAAGDQVDVLLESRARTTPACASSPRRRPTGSRSGTRSRPRASATSSSRARSAPA
jgi:small subunit ribosomal protein S1